MSQGSDAAAPGPAKARANVSVLLIPDRIEPAPPASPESADAGKTPAGMLKVRAGAPQTGDGGLAWSAGLTFWPRRPPSRPPEPPSPLGRVTPPRPPPPAVVGVGVGVAVALLLHAATM